MRRELCMAAGPPRPGAAAPATAAAAASPPDPQSQPPRLLPSPLHRQHFPSCRRRGSARGPVPHSDSLVPAAPLCPWGGAGAELYAGAVSFLLTLRPAPPEQAGVPSSFQCAGLSAPGWGSPLPGGWSQSCCRLGPAAQLRPGHRSRVSPRPRCSRELGAEKCCSSLQNLHPVRCPSPAQKRPEGAQLPAQARSPTGHCPLP